MRLESILRNVDSIVKWLGYLSAVVMIISALALFYIIIAVPSYRKGDYAVGSLIWIVSSFASMVSNFVLYIIVRACKVYLEKNATLVGQCE